MIKKILNWDSISVDTEALSWRIEFKPDIIIAIGRGGWIPAVLLSHRYDCKNVLNFSTSSYGRDHKQDKEIHTIQLPGLNQFAKDVKQNVIVVDDISDTGNTFSLINNFLQGLCGTEFNIKTASLYTKTGTSFIPDYYLREYSRDTWLVFPWETENTTTSNQKE